MIQKALSIVKANQKASMKNGVPDFRFMLGAEWEGIPGSSLLNADERELVCLADALATIMPRLAFYALSKAPLES